MEAATELVRECLCQPQPRTHLEVLEVQQLYAQMFVHLCFAQGNVSRNSSA